MSVTENRENIGRQRSDHQRAEWNFGTGSSHPEFSKAILGHNVRNVMKLKTQKVPVKLNAILHTPKVSCVYRGGL